MRKQKFFFAAAVLFVVVASRNGEGQWVKTSSPQGAGRVYSIVVNDNDLFAGMNGGGVFISKDSGITWNAVNNGLTNKYVWSVAVSGKNLFAGTSGGGIHLNR